MSAVSCGEAVVVQWSRGLQLMMHLVLSVLTGGDSCKQKKKNHAVQIEGGKKVFATCQAP